MANGVSRVTLSVADIVDLLIGDCSPAAGTYPGVSWPTRHVRSPGPGYLLPLAPADGVLWRR
jgi:hypothetical protein